MCTSQVYAAQVQVLGYSTKARTSLDLSFVPFPVPSSSGDRVLGECILPRWGGDYSTHMFSGIKELWQ